MDSSDTPMKKGRGRPRKQPAASSTQKPTPKKQVVLISDDEEFEQDVPDDSSDDFDAEQDNKRRRVEEDEDDDEDEDEIESDQDAEEEDGAELSPVEIMEPTPSRSGRRSRRQTRSSDVVQQQGPHPDSLALKDKIFQAFDSVLLTSLVTLKDQTYEHEATLECFPATKRKGRPPKNPKPEDLLPPKPKPAGVSLPENEQPSQVVSLITLDTGAGHLLKCIDPGCQERFRDMMEMKNHLDSYVHDALALLCLAYPRGDEPPLDKVPNEKWLPLDPSLGRYASHVTEQDFPWSHTFILYLPHSKTFFEYAILYGVDVSSDISPPKPSSTPRKKYIPVAKDKRCKEELATKPDAAMYSPTATPSEFIYPEQRPRLCDFIPVDDEEAMLYIPTQESCMMSHGTARSDAPSQLLNRFSSVFLTGASHKKRGVTVLNTGGSVWGLDWVPGIQEGECHYLAVGGYRGTIDEHHVMGMRQVAQEQDDPDIKGSIQLWNVGTLSSTTAGNTRQEPRLEVCIVHEYGCVYDLHWCPVGGYESSNEWSHTDPLVLPRLGFLGVSFGDGSLRVLNIPHPRVLRQRIMGSLCHQENVLYVKMTDILFEASLDTCMLWKLSWAGCHRLAAGCTDGSICVWDIQKVFENRMQEKQEWMEPIAHFPAHESCIRGIVWCDGEQGELPRFLLSSANDGWLMVHDIYNIWNSVPIYRIRAFMTTLAYAMTHEAFLFCDADNIVRYLRPGELDQKSKSKEGEDAKIGHSFSISAHHAAVWSLDVSRHVPFVLSGGADGSLILSNINRSNQRSRRPVLSPLYRLEWKQESETLKYVDSIQEQLLSQVTQKKSAANTLAYFYPPQVAIQKVAWNTNPHSHSFVASGGTAGLVRIENTFGL